MPRAHAHANAHAPCTCTMHHAQNLCGSLLRLSCVPFAQLRLILRIVRAPDDGLVDCGALAIRVPSNPVDKVTMSVTGFFSEAARAAARNTLIQDARVPGSPDDAPTSPQRVRQSRPMTERGRSDTELARPRSPPGDEMLKPNGEDGTYYTFADTKT
eukprot:841535-Prymnesium_polylepis.1